jgi:hypothetical protein
MGEMRGKSLKTLLDHFTSVQSKAIVRAGDAILNSEWKEFQAIADAISDSEIVTSIHDVVTSSQARFDELLRDLDPQVLKAMKGLLMMGVGGGALAESASLASVMTVSTLTIEILAIALILWGLALSLGVIWDRASTIIGDLRGA